MVYLPNYICGKCSPMHAMGLVSLHFWPYYIIKLLFQSLRGGGKPLKCRGGAVNRRPENRLPNITHGWYDVWPEDGRHADGVVGVNVAVFV